MDVSPSNLEFKGMYDPVGRGMTMEFLDYVQHSA